MSDEHNKLRLPLALVMNDGTKLSGELIAQIGGQIERTLNSDAKFIVFEDEAEGERFIAKTAIAVAKPLPKQR